jgi:hypothetical protein
MGGPDPRWQSPIGFGVADLYAARLELMQPERSQVRRFILTGSAETIHAILWMQRERGAAHWVFERAPDTGGAPGAFVAFDSVAAAGDSSLADAANLHEYVRDWTVPPAERSQPFWYRVSFTEGGVRWDGTARRVVSPGGPSAATVEVTIVHNAYDSDIDAAIEVGQQEPSGTATAGGGVAFPLPASSAALSYDWVTGVSALGNVEWRFRVEVPVGAADDFLPPSPGNRWRLRVSEDGLLNRSGRVTDFRVIHHTPGGDVITVGGPTPRQTVEGHTWYLTAPLGLTSVEPGAAETGWLRFGPNPVRSGHPVGFVAARDPGSTLDVYDLAGRQIARIGFTPLGSTYQAVWTVRGSSGEALPSGLYFARTAGQTARVVVIER